MLNVFRAPGSGSRTIFDSFEHTYFVNGLMRFVYVCNFDQIDMR